MAKFSFLLRHLANLCAPGLIVLLPFFGFVRYHGYPVWRPEVLLVVAAILALGVPLGLLISLRAKTLGAAVVVVLILAWSFDALLSTYPHIPYLWEGIRTQLKEIGGPAGMFVAIVIGSTLVAAVLLFLARSLDRNLGLVVTTVFGVGAISTFLVPGGSFALGEYYRNDRAMKPDLPPIIHLVLDEQMGLQGLPSEINGADELRNELRSFFEGYGFRVYGRAYSQYADTKLSIAAMLRGEPHRYILNNLEAEAAEESLRQNPWFELLAERGYRIRVYNSYDVSFCSKAASEVHSCYRYSANSVRSLKDSRLPVSTLAKAIFASFLDTLITYRAWLGNAPGVVRQGSWLPDWLRQLHKYAAPASLPILPKILQDLQSESRGQAIFAHLLIPHHTYLYDENCRIKPDIGNWANNVSPDAEFDLGLINTPDSRRRSYAKYFDQVRCTHRALQAFFEGLRKIRVFDDATIIVHGDHGSRIALATADNGAAGRLSDADLIDLYSVLYAVRGPAFASGYDESFRSIQALFAESMLERSLVQESNDVVLTFLADIGEGSQTTRWRRVPMAGF